jgi:hypothetical protein
MSERPSFKSSSRSSKLSKSSGSYGPFSTWASSLTISSGTTAGAGGCDGVPFIVIILIVNLSHVIEFILFGHLHDQLITGLDHSFQGGLLLVQLLSVFPQPLA